MKLRGPTITTLFMTSEIRSPPCSKAGWFAKPDKSATEPKCPQVSCLSWKNSGFGFHEACKAKVYRQLSKFKSLMRSLIKGAVLCLGSKKGS